MIARQTSVNHTAALPIIEEIIKCEIQVKSNFGYRFEQLYTYASKEKALLEAARSNKSIKSRTPKVR